MIEEEIEIDPYETLNLPPNASRKDIKDRYNLLSIVFHPDKQLQNGNQEVLKAKRQQYSLIETSYKILSTPFNKFIYDNLGIDGIRLYDTQDTKNKFIDLKSDFINLYNIVNDPEVSQDLKLNAQKKLAIVEKQILQRFWGYSRQLREVNDYKNVYRRIDISTDFNCKNYVKPTTPFSKNDFMILTKAAIIPNIALPNLYGIDNSVTFYLSGAKEPYSKGGDNALMILRSQYAFSQFKYNFIKNMTARQQFKYGSTGKELTLEFDKPISDSLVISGKSSFSKDGVIPSVSIDRVISETQRIRTEFSYYGTIVGSVGHQYQINPKLKLDSDINYSPGNITLDQNISYFINKRFSILAGLSSNISQKSKSQLIVGFQGFCGFQLNLNKSSMVEVKGYLGYGKNGIEIKFQRYLYNWSIPFNFHPQPYQKSTNFILGFIGITGYLAYIYSKLRKTIKIKRIKLEEKNKEVLEQSKSNLNQMQNDLKNKITPLILEEVFKLNGLVVLRAYIGNKQKINILSKFHNKNSKGKLKKIENEKDRREQISKLLVEQDQLQIPIDDIANSVTCEVADITLLLIAHIYQSVLKIDFIDYEGFKGIYNPCLDPKEAPVIYIQYIQHGKIQQKKINFGQTVIIGDNIQKQFSLNKYIIGAFT